MADLVVGIGLVLVFEGLLWALVPNLALRVLAAVAATPEHAVRVAGWSSAVLGLGLVWLIRG